MIHSNIEVRISPISGRGLFAHKPILRGEVVWQKDEGEARYHLSEIIAWPEETRRFFYTLAYQIDDEYFSGPLPGSPEDPGDFMNHSCNPTSWFETDSVMVATRDIAVDEEITYDYATSEVSPVFSMPCNCKTIYCRSIITGLDFLRPDLQHRYGDHVMAHVKRMLLKTAV
jgi:SET domain-containing protein